jgi:hypothetical protein
MGQNSSTQQKPITHYTEYIYTDPQQNQTMHSTSTEYAMGHESAVSSTLVPPENIRKYYNKKCMSDAINSYTSNDLVESEVLTAMRNCSRDADAAEGFTNSNNMYNIFYALVLIFIIYSLYNSGNKRYY